MNTRDFDEWLAELDLSFWGLAQHKVTPAQFFDRQQSEGALLLDVRSPEEAEHLALPSALHIPVRELPSRWREIPADRLVATFCSSVTRAVVACLQPVTEASRLSRGGIVRGQQNALESYTLAAAWALGRFGTTANVLCPPATDAGWITPEMAEEMAKSPPLYHVGRPEDVAEVVVFLASEQARFITGQRLVMR